MPTRSRWRASCSTGCRWDEVAPPAAVPQPVFDAEELMGIVPADERDALRRARGDRPPRRRLRLPRVQGRLRDRHGLRPRAHRRPSQSASSATTARSSRPARPRRRSSSSSATRAARRWSSCRTPPATWSARAAERAGAIKHGCEDDPGGGQRAGAQVHHRARRLVSAPATTACAAAASTRASSSPGRRHAPP